jgi:hypothetical protein
MAGTILHEEWRQGAARVGYSVTIFFVCNSRASLQCNIQRRPGTTYQYLSFLMFLLALYYTYSRNNHCDR